MTGGDPSLVTVAANITLILLLLGMGLAFFRLVLGPDAADRIVALDLISILVVAFLAVYAVFANEATFINVAIAYALVAFLGTIALARYRLNSCRTPPADAQELDGKGCAVIFPEAANGKRDDPAHAKRDDRADGSRDNPPADSRKDPAAPERTSS